MKCVFLHYFIGEKLTMSKIIIKKTERKMLRNMNEEEERKWKKEKTNEIKSGRERKKKKETFKGREKKNSEIKFLEWLQTIRWY